MEMKRKQDCARKKKNISVLIQMICPKNKHLVYPLNFSMLWHNEGAFHFLWLSIFIKQILFLPICAYRKIKHFKSCFRHDNWCTTDGGILVCLNAHVLRF